MNCKQILFASALACFALAGSSFADGSHDGGHDEHPSSKQTTEKIAVFEGDPYLLKVDVVTGKDLGPVADQVVIDFEGRELRFSSEKSAKTFRASPKGYVEKTDALMIADQLPLYPLTTCMISGDKLGGDMGEPVDMIYKNRLVRFCCKMCIGKFKKSPDKYIAELNAAVVKEQVKDYPYKNCLISGCILYTSPRPRDGLLARKPSSA
jgi:YHS domain-containing protein